MRRRVVFDPDAWEQFGFWLQADRKIAIRIVRLTQDIQRDPFEGIGKPEPLKGDLTGYWSRRVTDEHRLVYRVSDKDIVVLQCRFHYR